MGKYRWQKLGPHWPPPTLLPSSNLHILHRTKLETQSLKFHNSLKRQTTLLVEFFLIIFLAEAVQCFSLEILLPAWSKHVEIPYEPCGDRNFRVIKNKSLFRCLQISCHTNITFCCDQWWWSQTPEKGFVFDYSKIMVCTQLIRDFNMLWPCWQQNF